MRAALALCALCVLSAPTSDPRPPTSGQWPQFRGTDGQGHSDQTGLPLEWSETKNIAWKVPVPGRGWSSPVIAGGRVWLTTATAVKRDTSLRLMASDVDTGRT